MINLVAEYCKNCLQNLYRLLENLDLQCFIWKQCDGVVYISSDTSQCVWSFPSVGHFLRKPHKSLLQILYILSYWNENFIFMYILKIHKKKML